MNRSETLRTESFDLLTEAQALKKQGDYLLARDVLLRAAEVSPRPVIYYEIGNCYFQLGNDEQAIAYYDKALELMPDYSLAKAERDLAEARMSGDQAMAQAAPVAQPAPAQEKPVAAPGTRTLSTPPPPTPTTPPTEHPDETEVDDEDTGPTVALGTADRVTEGTMTASPVPPVPAQETPAPTPVPEPAVAAAPAPTTAAPAPAPAAPAARTPGSPLQGLAETITTGPLQRDPADNPEPLDREKVREILFPELLREESVDVAELSARAAEADRLGRYDESVRLWQRVLRREPESLSAKLGMARALQRSGRTRRAEELLRAAETQSPQDAQVLFEKGNYFLALGKKDLALESYEDALATDPAHLRALNNASVLHLEHGRYSEAIDGFSTIVKQDGTFAPAWLNLALAQDGAGMEAGEVLFSLENYARLAPEIAPETDRWMRELRRRIAQGTPETSG